MVAYSIDAGSIKTFMNNLLKGDMFDEFLIRTAEAETFVTFSIDGRLNKEFFEEEPEAAYCLWRTLRPYFFDLIKGATKPKSMKFVFSMNVEATTRFDENAAALFINVTFADNALTCVTGCQQKNFALTKTLDLAWDQHVYTFLKEHQIISTHLE